ncbi:MAG TPA: DUF2283 domain-containing protein [Stellaceae bacterium]|nr:DUF2283 domain-containing protein [Stellaceae bacterium]
MKFTFDPKRNVAYLSLRSAEGVEIETVAVSDAVNVDLAPDGSVCGIELLDANTQLAGTGEAHLVLELAGRRVEVPLPELA